MNNGTIWIFFFMIWCLVSGMVCLVKGVWEDESGHKFPMNEWAFNTRQGIGFGLKSIGQILRF